ncbi:hypothetical protein HHI36_015164 [Cryptolaemus montrouzieri]|uniref:Uncharacterized protein n=1 Tax=Cryptolaemus montrouzieri TaxID=559131 RepID=A0ABD2N4T0_9CUCU
MGDINIDILDNANNDVNDYLSTLVYFGFLPYIKRPTMFDSGTYLDHIFVKQKLRAMKMKLKSYVLDTHLTDYAPVLLNINSEDFLNTSGDGSIVVTNNKLNFDELLISFDWSPITNIQNGEIATTKFIDTFKELMEESKIEYRVNVKSNKKSKSGSQTVSWSRSNIEINLKEPY